MEVHLSDGLWGLPEYTSLPALALAAPRPDPNPISATQGLLKLGSCYAFQEAFLALSLVLHLLTLCLGHEPVPLGFEKPH